jgi:hypothetical protein
VVSKFNHYLLFSQENYIENSHSSKRMEKQRIRQGSKALLGMKAEAQESLPGHFHDIMSIMS